MKYQTMEQLSEMKLHAMKLEYQRQQELPAMNDLPFDDRFGAIVNSQHTARNEAKIKRLMKAADLRDPAACLANVDYETSRRLKKTQIMQLADCEWIKSGSNLIVTGATGVGKTFLLSAFGREACMRGYVVRSYRVTRMLTDLAIGRGDGSYNKIMADLAKPDLLILDDFGMKQLDLALTQDLLEIVEERYHSGKSIALSAQLPVKEWTTVFKDLTIADAVLDRIVRNAYRFELKGASRRPTIQHSPPDGGSAPGGDGDKNK
jgi:DNA replication protein DnaC